MPRTLHPDTMATELIDVKRRLSALERTNQKQFSLLNVDENGVVRMEGGDIAARGISPAQVGLRVNDENGDPIFDTLGLVDVMRLLDQATAADENSISASGYIPGTEVSFTLSRARTILCLGQVGGYITFSGGGVVVLGDTFVQIDGQPPGPRGSFGGVKTGISVYHVLSLPAGSYTGGIYWDQIQPQHVALNYWDRQLDIFGMGA